MAKKFGWDANSCFNRLARIKQKEKSQLNVIKLFNVRNLCFSAVSCVCPWQAFTAESNVSGQGQLSNLSNMTGRGSAIPNGR